MRVDDARIAALCRQRNTIMERYTEVALNNAVVTATSRIVARRPRAQSR